MEVLKLNRTEKSQSGIAFATLHAHPGHIIVYMDDASAWNGHHLDEGEVDELVIWLNDWRENLPVEHHEN